MSELSLEQKKAQFDEYFSIAHRINANVRPLGADEIVPDEENLEESMLKEQELKEVKET